MEQADRDWWVRAGGHCGPQGHILRELGLKHTPVAGMPKQVLHGVEVYVLPLVPKREGERPNIHRMRALCPECGKDMSAGRLHQHMDTVACQREYQRRF